MPDFKGTDNFYLVLAFIVPGLIILYVRSRFITGRVRSHTENVLSYLVLSLVYYTLTIPFIDKALSIQHPWSLRAGIWIALTLAGPAVLGLLLGAEAQNEWLTWIAARFHLSVVHMIPAAWDWRFSKISASGTFVMVTLTSDEKVSGYFGSASFASSDSTERDLYIEEEYLLTDEGLWKPRPRRGECLFHLRKSNILNSGNRRIKVLKMSTSKHVPQASSQVNKTTRVLANDGYQPRVIHTPPKSSSSHDRQWGI